MDPSLKHGPFSVTEDEQLQQLHKKLGSRWSKIASSMVGRTADAVKVRFKSLQRLHDREERRRHSHQAAAIGIGHSQQPNKKDPQEQARALSRNDENSDKSGIISQSIYTGCNKQHHALQGSLQRNCHRKRGSSEIWQHHDNGLSLISQMQHRATKIYRQTLPAPVKMFRPSARFDTQPLRGKDLNGNVVKATKVHIATQERVQDGANDCITCEINKKHTLSKEIGEPDPIRCADLNKMPNSADVNVAYSTSKGNHTAGGTHASYKASAPRPIQVDSLRGSFNMALHSELLPHSIGVGHLLERFSSMDMEAEQAAEVTVSSGAEVGSNDYVESTNCDSIGSLLNQCEKDCEVMQMQGLLPRTSSLECLSPAGPGEPLPTSYDTVLKNGKSTPRGTYQQQHPAPRAYTAHP